MSNTGCDVNLVPYEMGIQINIPKELSDVDCNVRTPLFLYVFMCLEWNQFNITAVIIDLLYQPWVIDGDDCGATRVMNE
jgi:hypothetical protein